MFVMARTKAGVAIQTRLHDKGFTQGKAARTLGRSQTWVSQGLLDDTEKTLRRMWVDTPEMFKKLLDMLGWDSERFAKEIGIYLSVPYPTPNIFSDEATLDNPDLRAATRLIPVYDLLAAGDGFDGGTIVDYVDIPDSWKGPHAAYIVAGDSMSPRIPDRAKVVIRCQDYASPGNIIVCNTRDEGMLVKFLNEKPDGMHVLTSFNPNYDPIWVAEDAIKIYGVVREIRTLIEIINGNHI